MFKEIEIFISIKALSNITLRILNIYWLKLFKENKNKLVHAKRVKLTNNIACNKTKNSLPRKKNKQVLSLKCNKKQQNYQNNKKQTIIQLKLGAF